MKTHDPNNERIKREYFTYLKEAKGFSASSLDGVAQALHRFETYTRFRDFHKFHIQQVVAFKQDLAGQRNVRAGKPLSKATLLSTVNALKAFFLWLAGQPTYRSRIGYADAAYFSLSEKDMRVARAHREQRVPTIEEIMLVIEAMPAATPIERRDRAVIAFALVTGARDSAIASLKLKHVDLTEERVFQDAREVKTKASKTITTDFFPVGDSPKRIVAEWVAYLQTELLWSPEDPLFPATRVTVGDNRHFVASGLARTHWSSAGPIRDIFKVAFARAGVPYANPHSFRKTLVRLGERHCRTPEEFKAWSQNLGHEQVLTTFSSYGKVEPRRQSEIIRSLGQSKEVDEDMELAKQLARTLRQARGSK